ncbi:MAG: Na+/H+ antiporter subunit E [Sphingomonadaceae bacterium]
MKRWIPHPLLAIGLTIMWLALNQSMSPGHILLGAGVALLASQGFMALKPKPVRMRFTRAIPRLILLMLGDVVRSNIAVGRIVLQGGGRARDSGFIHLPLEMRSDYGLAALAIIITATPGTLWMQYDHANGVLLVHTLDRINEEEWTQRIKRLYEPLLMEIFE